MRALARYPYFDQNAIFGALASRIAGELMNLDKALLDSGMWLVQAYLITVVLSAATIWGLAKFTVWGRQFWSLTAAFFRRGETGAPWPPCC